jgi:hypothetical protein
MDFQFTERQLQDNSWSVYLFIGSFLLVAIVRAVFDKQFKDFLGLVHTNKYIKLYGETSLSWFSVVLTLVQLISYSFFIQIMLSYFGMVHKTNFEVFIRIFAFVSLFFGLKYLINRSIAGLFDIQDFCTKGLFYQTSYKMYLGLFLLLASFIMFYAKQPNIVLAYVLLSIFLLLHLIIYFISLRVFRKEILSNMFYFILYLCTLEIAPYYFTYYWFTK